MARRKNSTREGLRTPDVLRVSTPDSQDGKVRMMSTMVIGGTDVGTGSLRSPTNEEGLSFQYTFLPKRLATPEANTFRNLHEIPPSRDGKKTELDDGPRHEIPDWQVYRSTSKGFPYWYNRHTGESRWLPPESGSIHVKQEFDFGCFFELDACPHNGSKCIMLNPNTLGMRAGETTSTQMTLHEQRLSEKDSNANDRKWFSYQPGYQVISCVKFITFPASQ